MNDLRRRLLWHGMFLFLLGLITGLIQASLTNPRMGLAAHLEGVLNGILLLAIGSIWADVVLAQRTKAIAFWLLLYGAYANWATTLLAAILGTKALSPITSAGHSGQPWQETLVTAGFTSVGLTILAATVLLLWGLRRR